jgi:hypothetical protein
MDLGIDTHTHTHIQGASIFKIIFDLLEENEGDFTTKVWVIQTLPFYFIHILLGFRGFPPKFGLGHKFFEKLYRNINYFIMIMHPMLVVFT